MNIKAVIDFFKRCKEYTQIIERLDALEKNVTKLQNQIKYTDKMRICPRCHEPTLNIDYVEKEVLASYNTLTEEKQYDTRKVFVARCSSCNWECDNQEFVNQRLHPL